MPIFNRAFNCGDVNSQEDSKKIIIATILIGTILSLFLFILSSEVTFFLIGNKIHIDNKMISDILRFSSFQILFYCVIKLLNTILIINRKINIALYAGLFASLVSTMLELLLYKKIGIYAMLIAQYGFLGVEFLILTYLLMKKPAIYKFLRNIIGYRDLCLIFGKLVILTLILILISKYILVMVKNIREFRLMFLMIYSLWGLITFVLFFKDLKIFIFKSKIPKHVS
jgi:peptidoglycan biosynthesis protein MviN/MurJ (putative lipid II flippase)